MIRQSESFEARHYTIINNTVQYIIYSLQLEEDFEVNLDSIFMYDY